MTLDEFAAECHATSRDNGFKKLTTMERLLMIHTEVSEAVEVLRENPEKMSTKIPHPQFDEELADIVIRVLDLAASLDIKLSKVIKAKARFNKGRPWKHGKNF